MPPIPPLTQALMLICTAVFCIGIFVPLEYWFALWPLQSGLFWPWQLVSYGFLHGSMLHLFFTRWVRSRLRLERLPLRAVLRQPASPSSC